MNEPAPHIESDDDIGPLDEHGQQIWSPELEAAMERAHRDPEYWAGIARGREDIAAGRVYSQEEAAAHMAQVRARFFAERRR